MMQLDGYNVSAMTVVDY